MDLTFEEIKVGQNQELNQCGINSEICGIHSQIRGLDNSDTSEWEEIIEAKAGSLQY